MDNMELTAIIPARGGSKRIPEKNIIDFHGQPIISRVIRTAYASGLFGKIIVSTDDQEVALIAKAAKADVIKRPAFLSDEHAPILPVIQHVIETKEIKKGYICLILATAVFLKPDHLRKAYSKIKKDKTLEFVIGVKKFESAPQRALKMNRRGNVSQVYPGHINSRSQDLEPLFFDAGLFSLGKVKAFQRGKHSFASKTYGLKLSEFEAIDIDEPSDLRYAKKLFLIEGFAPKERVIIRCDTSRKSGLGHYKRCIGLTEDLMKVGFDNIFFIENNKKHSFLKNKSVVKYIKNGLNQIEDARATIDLAEATGAKLILKDHFSLDHSWDECVKKSGLKLLAFDELNNTTIADIVVNYSPEAVKPEILSAKYKFLGGEQYFISNIKKRNKNVAKKMQHKVLLFVGGTGNIKKHENLVRAAISKASEYNLEIYWLGLNIDSEKLIQRLENNFSRKRILPWQENNSWENYDFVICPPSTVLFETILQGSIPITYTLSKSQTDNRNSWLSLGHACHITRNELSDQKKIEKIIDIAIKYAKPIHKYLKDYSKNLDGNGGRRIAHEIIQLIHPKPKIRAIKKNILTNNSKILIRPCSIKDIENFRYARNDIKARSVSTNPERLISWAEHLEWWLGNDIDKFTMEQHGKSLIYFWHKAVNQGNRRFLVGGWFPACDGPIFNYVVKMLSWQLSELKKSYPDHKWLATINKKNKPVLALNLKMGFKYADPLTVSFSKNIFPGTNDDFHVLTKDLN